MRPELTDLARREWPGATLEPVAGDASTRRFFRVSVGTGPTRILMDYGAPFSGESGDMRALALFHRAGLPVAKLIASYPEVGCLLLEDLGDRTLEDALAQEGAPGLLTRAADLALRVAVEGTAAVREELPALDAERFRFELDWFAEHYGAFRGIRRIPAGVTQGLHALADLADEPSRRVLCHRDFHCRDLMVRGDGTLAMVDVQDARWGPDTYDLASLLRDAYSDPGPADVERLIPRFHGGLPDPGSLGGFRRRFDVVAAQRMLKALGTFGYQLTAMGRERYRPAADRTAGRLRELLPLRAETKELGAALRDCGLL